jgi:hypothetical protein
MRLRVLRGYPGTHRRSRQCSLSKIAAELEKRIQGQLRAGKGILATAKELGVGTGTVHRRTILHEVPSRAASVEVRPRMDGNARWSRREQECRSKIAWDCERALSERRRRHANEQQRSENSEANAAFA